MMPSFFLAKEIFLLEIKRHLWAPKISHNFAPLKYNKENVRVELELLEVANKKRKEIDGEDAVSGREVTWHREATVLSGKTNRQL